MLLKPQAYLPILVSTCIPKYKHLVFKQFSIFSFSNLEKSRNYRA